jgi:hypothetical protein
MLGVAEKMKKITKRVRQILKVYSDGEVDCQVIGNKRVKNLSYIEGAKPKRRTLQKRQDSFVVTVPKSWVQRKIVGPWKGLDKTEVIIRQWRDPETGKFKGVIVEIAEKEESKSP